MRIVDESEGASLNRQFRGKDYATNVLTFGYDEAEPLLGDIALCGPIVSREAASRGISAEAHYAHLVVHAILHLHGAYRISWFGAVLRGLLLGWFSAIGFGFFLIGVFALGVLA